MKRSTFIYVAITSLFVVIIYNAWVAVPVMNQLKDETNVSILVYRSGFLNPTDIVFDLRDVKNVASMADVDRSLFEAAEALKDRNYRSVILAYKGRSRYRLDGDQFHTIGQEWSFQNPLYVVRTLPEYVSNMAGSPAFETYTGGWLGVMTKQIEQHNELHMRWYLLAMAGQNPDGPIPEMPSSDM